MTVSRKNFARIKTLTYIYADACFRGYDEFLNCSAQVEIIGEDEFDSDLYELERRRDIAGFQAIVFSAMCFESAIYEYAADHLGDSYVRAHIDKLDVLSKWIIVLRLVAGYEIQKDKAPYAALKALIAARNNLVHSKSEPINLDEIENQIDRINVEIKKHTAEIHNSYKALLLMSMELDSVIGIENNPLPCYDRKHALMLEVLPRLKPAFQQCRKMMGLARDV